MYDYETTLAIDIGTGFLNLILSNRRLENLCIAFLNKLIYLCDYCDFVLNYICNMPPPSVLYAKWTDWIRPFLLTYIAEAEK